MPGHARPLLVVAALLLTGCTTPEDQGQRGPPIGSCPAQTATLDLRVEGGNATFASAILVGRGHLEGVLSMATVCPSPREKTTVPLDGDGRGTAEVDLQVYREVRLLSASGLVRVIAPFRVDGDGPLQVRFESDGNATLVAGGAEAPVGAVERHADPSALTDFEMRTSLLALSNETRRFPLAVNSSYNLGLTVEAEVWRCPPQERDWPQGPPLILRLLDPNGTVARSEGINCESESATSLTTGSLHQGNWTLEVETWGPGTRPYEHRIRARFVY